MSECWFMPQTVADRRAENRLSPNRPSDYETLAAIGVFYKRFDPAAISDDVEAFINPLLAEMRYHAHDVITISPTAMGEEKFESMAKTHFEEHLHEDDEVRLILEGSGYFDLRSAEDEWIRVRSLPGDCIVVPAGIYHRFTTDEQRYIKTIRLFKENPKWVAIARETGEGDKTEARRAYLSWLHAPPLSVAGPAENARNGIYVLRFPNAFDAGMTRILVQLAKTLHQRHADAGGVAEAGGALLLYVTGAASPYTHGESWCPDCVAVKPAVVEGLALLKRRYEKGEQQHKDEDNAVVFVEAPVERAAYRGNPEYPYRTHEFLAIKGVPTVFVLTLKDDALPMILANEDKVLKEKKWFELVQTRVRTEEPTAQLLSEF